MYLKLSEFKWTDDDIITGDKYLSLECDKIAYVKTDTLVFDQPIEWRGAVHTKRPAIIWITGHSDFPITPELFDKYEQHVEWWFATNKQHVHPKLCSLPIGITNNTKESNDHIVFGNTAIMLEVAARPQTLHNLVYMNFLIGTYPTERQQCYDTFSGKPWVTVGQSAKTLDARKKFLTEIRNHAFVLCPRGNGIDTHRIWETLYMGSIPIVKKDIAMNEFIDLPILFIDKWSDITEEFLLEQYERIRGMVWNMDKLTFGYWKRLIQQKKDVQYLHRVTLQV
jgi:hypothetical protein